MSECDTDGSGLASVESLVASVERQECDTDGSGLASVESLVARVRRQWMAHGVLITRGYRVLGNFLTQEIISCSLYRRRRWPKGGVSDSWQRERGMVRDAQH